MFEGSLTDQMTYQSAINDTRAEGLQVNAALAAGFVILYIKESNGWVLTSGKFYQWDILGAINFLIKTRNDYRSWK